MPRVADGAKLTGRGRGVAPNVLPLPSMRSSMRALPLLPLARLGATLALALSAVPAAAQSVTVGTANGDNCIPFTCQFVTQRYQQVYAASALGGPALISAIGFTLLFPDNPAVGAGTYTIRLGYTQAPVNGLNAFLDANVAGPLTTFASVTFPVGPAPVPFRFVGAAPFAYDPALGNLLLDVEAEDQQGGYAAFASDNRGTVTSRAYVEGDFSGADAVGLVTTFDVVRSTTTTPEPTTVTLLGAGVLAVGGIGARRRARRGVASPARPGH
jgi:hypothetical protein